VQDATGLGAIPVVAVAGHDTGSAVAAVPASDKEYAYLSCGTWSLMGIESAEPIINKDSFRENFTNEGGIEGTTRFLKNICGLWLFEQSRKEFKDVPESVGELVALCEESSYEGLINPDAPCFAAPASMTAAIREYCVSTGQAAPEIPADYIRCIFRSLALRYRQVVEILRSMCGFPIKKLHVIGGGSQNKYLMQYAANALNMPIVCGPVEGTALGNVLMQMKASGAVSSLGQMREISAASVDLVTYLPEDTEIWNELYKKYLNKTTK
jgi:rhamnulokinase